MMNRAFGRLLVILVLALCSCSHKDIMCPGGELRQINVCFEWDKAPGASPEGMSLYFFPAGKSGRIWRFDIAGDKGGPVELPTGSYRLVTFNNDLPGITIDGTDSFGSISAYARGKTPAGVFNSTGMLYGTVVSSIEVTPCGIEYITENGSVKECRKSVLRCYPDSLSAKYTVHIKNVNTPEMLRSASVRLKGVASDINLSTAESSDAASTVSFQLEKSDKAPRLSGRGYAFPSDYGAKHTLTVALTRVDGKTFARDFDVTDQIMNSPSRHNVLLVIDSIDVPVDDTPEDDVGGIDVDVDGWNAIETDIIATLP